MGVLFTCCAWADQLGDRIAILQTLASLNSAQTSEIFAADGHASEELARLRAAHPKGFRIVGSTARPSVAISHEVWGEATLTIPAEFPLNRPVTFVSADVALIEGACSFEDEKGLESTPLLFVLKRESSGWKISAVRELATRI
jgi:hypothetical protein